jgi:hypothetical protein
MKLNYKLLAGVALALSLGSCKNDFEYSNQAAGKAYVAVHHAAPATTATGNTNVELYLNDKNVTDTFRAFSYNTSFGGVSPYMEVAPGMVSVKINAYRTTTELIPTTNLSIAPNTFYSVFAYDTIRPTATPKIKALVLTDELSVPAPGNAKLRFLHLVPNGPNVDVWAFRSATDSVKLYNNIPYIGSAATPDAVTLSNFATVPGQLYTALVVRVAGTNSQVTRVDNITFAPGKIYSVLARGLAGLPTSSANALGARVILHN